MKKVKSQAADGDMRSEYEFSGAVRGKYYARFRRSSNVALEGASLDFHGPELS